MLLAIISLAEGVVKVSAFDPVLKKLLDRGGCGSNANQINAGYFRMEVLSSMVRLSHRRSDNVWQDLGSMSIDAGTLNYPISLVEGEHVPRIERPFKLTGWVDYMRQHAPGVEYNRKVWAKSTKIWDLEDGLWECSFPEPNIAHVLKWLDQFYCGSEIGDVQMTHTTIRKGVTKSNTVAMNQIDFDRADSEIHVTVPATGDSLTIDMRSEDDGDIDDFVVTRVVTRGGGLMIEPLGYMRCRWTPTGFQQQELYNYL